MIGYTLIKVAIIGSGTELDYSRFRYLLSRTYGVDARNVHALIIGEQGETAVPVWNETNIAGMPILKYGYVSNSTCTVDHRDRIFKTVVDAGRGVIKRQSATFYAIALAMERLIFAIVPDEKSVLTVLTVGNNFYDFKNVCFNLPTILNRDGIVRHLNLSLKEAELIALHKSTDELNTYNSALFNC